MAKKRDDFAKKVKDLLAKRVGFLCSNPHCRRATSGPHTDPGQSISVGVAAHIEAAAPGGRRFAARMTPAERGGVANGIWLCQQCSRLVDTDEQRYPTVLLLQWKVRAEERARISIERPQASAPATTVTTFRALCIAIEPLLAENRAVFRSFGPKSGASDDGVRWHLAMWEVAKRKTIVPNNSEIARLLTMHSTLIPEKHQKDVERMLAHVCAFDEHCKNPYFDYSEHQFPRSFSDFIQVQASNTDAEDLENMRSWLTRQLAAIGLDAKRAAIIGSVLSTSRQINDVDLLLLLRAESGGLAYSTLAKTMELRRDFEVVHKIPLHVIAFTEQSEDEYQSFLAENQHIIVKN